MGPPALQRRGQPAVDEKSMAVDVGRGGRGEEHGDPADLLALPPAADRRALADEGGERLVGDERRVHLGGEIAGRDGVAADAVRPELDGERLGERDEPALCRYV